MTKRGPPSAAPASLGWLQLGGDGLDFGVGLEDLVAHLAAPAGLLVAAERQGRVEDVVAVDPDRAGPELLGQGVGLGDVLGPDPGTKAVDAVVRLGGDLVQGPERGGDHDRAEDLLADDGHIGPGVGDDGGIDEVALVTEAAAAGDGGGTIVYAGLEEAGDPAQLLVGDQRAHLGAGLHAGTELDALGDLGDAVDDLVEAVLLDEQARARHAALAVVEEDRVGRALDRAGVGVVEHDVGTLAAGLQRDLLEVPRGRLHDQLADLGGAGECYLVHVVVGGQGRASGLAEAGDHIHHASGYARVGHELGQQQ